MYDTKEEANQKLGQTVVLFQNQPAYIIEAVGKGTKLALRYQLMRKKEERSNFIQESGWEFRNLGQRLGYMNYAHGDSSYKEALYTTRVAVRQAHNTQGLSHRNVRFPHLKGSARLGLERYQLNWQSVYPTEGFMDALEDKYPTFTDIKSQFSSDNYLTSKAFNKHFAIRRHDVGPYYLEYKGKDIGYTQDFDKWKIAEDYKYLAESLEHLTSIGVIPKLEVA